MMLSLLLLFFLVFFSTISFIVDGRFDGDRNEISSVSELNMTKIENNHIINVEFYSQLSHNKTKDCLRSDFLPKMRICDGNDLTIGHWFNVTSHHHKHHHKHNLNISRHFYNGGPGEALNFTQIWIPHNCRYHRFTNQSLLHLIDYIANKSYHNPTLHIPITKEKRIHLAFIGDERKNEICWWTKI
jgi:hypothetical protein